MEPNKNIKNLKAYSLNSHKAWEINNKKDVLKLDWNESTCSIPSFIKKLIKKKVNDEFLNWYPDINNRKLIKVIAGYVKVPEDYIQYFEGSDCALDYIIRTFINMGDEVLVISPTYDNFRVYVQSIGAKIKFIFPKNIFQTDLNLIKQNISTKTKMVYLANPNNPTGVFYNQLEVESLLENFPYVFFILDEAYAEFNKITFSKLVLKYKNLIVSKTLSKAFGLASFRFGYVISHPENIYFINKIRNGKNIATLTQLVALEAFRSRGYVNKYIKEVEKSKKYLFIEFTKMNLDVKITSANFILLKVKNPKEICSRLARDLVFIRNLNHLKGMENYIRITVGDIKTMKKFIYIFKKIFKNDVNFR